MRHRNKGLSAVLAAVILIQLLAPMAWAAEGDTITIHTAEELVQLSRDCALDSWSQDKTVCLAADIDLTGTDFQAIPTFGGTFDGGGHTISGLSLTGSGNTQGLFRYLQPGGTVRDLNVKGNLSPTDFRDTIGGIVGDNQGQILRCTFRGSVSGKTDVGGIAGCNRAGGQIIGCTASGSVSGELHTGGIVGQNQGSVIQCTNQSGVNTTELETPADPQTILQEESVTDAATDLSGWTDVGGVAGLSTGILQDCSNQGAVGYPHVGYNVGGIAGRQNGFLDGCVNTGAIQGRKDVGGIVGQLEPSVTLLYQKDFLERLGGELDVLQNRMDGLLTDAGGASNSLSAQLSQLSGQTQAAKNAVEGLSDAMVDWTDESIGQVNDLSARLSQALDDLTPILDDVDDQLTALSKAADQFSSAVDKAAQLGTITSDMAGELRQAVTDASDGAQALRNAREHVSSALDALKNGLGDPAGAVRKALEHLREAASEASRALTLLARSGKHLADGLGYLEDGGAALDSSLRNLAKAGQSLSDVLDDLAGSAGRFHQVVRELADGADFQLPSLDAAVSGQSGALSSAFSGLMEGADDLNTLIANSTDTLLDDLKAINAQLGVISDLVRDEGKRMGETQLEDRIQDVSGQQALENQSTGRVSACRNEGSVDGDVDVAGIVGAMAIDLEFDPEDDLSKQGERSADFLVQARASVFDCINSGLVTGKKDNSGGIAGRMDLGRIERCENYGDVTSTDGSYVGGVAGLSSAVIRNCWSRCTLAGSHYVGGIAGQGSTLTDCRAAVELSRGGAYLGAVAGNVESNGTVNGNLFTSDTMAAIDGISYAGKAEPADFETLCTLPDAPADFARLTLTFTADGETVAVFDVPYGEGLSSLPDIPAKEGCSAAWPELDYSRITASCTVEVVYTPYTSALSGGGELPEILVDGSFSSGAQVSHTSQDTSWTDQEGKTHQGTVWSVTVTDPELDEVSYTIHYRLPEQGGRWQLWVRGADGWQKQDSTVDGSYLLLKGTGETTEFCVLPQPFPVMQLLLGLLLLALAAVVLLLVIRRRRTKIRA